MSKFSTGLLLGRIEANKARQEAAAQDQYIRRLELEKQQMQERVSDLVAQNRDLRARVAGLSAIRNRLKQALREVAPDHELGQNPSPALSAIGEKAFDEEFAKG